MIQIESFARKKKKGTSSNSSTSTSIGGGFASSKVTVEEVKGVNIWGQYHDHTEDINGDLTSSGTITGANITSTGSITAETGQINGNLGIGGNATITGNATADNGVFAGNLSCDDLTSDSIETTNLESTEIVTDRLTVTQQAHFFNLTIDEIKSVGGQIILSAANATIDHVDKIGDDYELSWRKEDGSKGIENMFKVGDQVICQTFNKTDATGQNVSNKYYWSLITSMGETMLVIDGREYECYYINISGTVFDGTLTPAVGDKICQLGYRGNDDSARQSAIILSAYQSPDPNVTAPSIVQYAGINSFSLDDCIVNQMSPTENIFTGDFKVVNGSTTTDIIDLVQGQYPQVIVDSEQAWMMADSSGKTYEQTDYQNLPTTIQAFLGSQIIPYSEWTTGSQVKFRGRTFNLTGATPSPSTGTGLLLNSITRNTNDVTLGWTYAPNTSYNTQTQTTTNNGTLVSNMNLEITLVFTHSGTTYTVTKKVPFSVIKASAVTQGADAEFDKIMVDKMDLTVTIDNKLTCKLDAKVFHIKGSQISQVTDLTDYSANLTLSNNDTVSLSKSNHFYRNTNISNSYSSMTNPPTSALLKVYKEGTLIDELPGSIKFDSGSIFTITDNAITSAVSQANSYTDTQVSVVTQTANSISSRVTAIENDYITSSELTQTANNIQLNVYDELRNKTGIDITNGKIVLNGNTEIDGNLNITDSTQGFTLVGSEGITQISPQSIGTYNSFTSKTYSTININNINTQLGSSYSGGNINYEAYRFNFTNDYNLGTIKSGKTITCRYGTGTYRSYSGTIVNNWTELSKSYKVFENGVEKASGTLPTTNIYSFTYTSDGGNVTIEIYSSTVIPKNYYSSQDIIAASYTLTSYFDITNDAYMLIGYDGIAVNFGTSATAYIGAESTTFNYGNYGLQISPNGLKRWTGSEWVGLNQLNVKTYSSSHILEDGEDFLIFTGASNSNLVLGNGGSPGRIVYVKDLKGGYLYVGGAEGIGVYDSNNKTPTVYPNKISVNNAMIFLVWDGSAWYLGYCG